MKEQRFLSETVSWPLPGSGKARGHSRAHIQVNLLGNFVVTLNSAPLDTIKGTRMQALFAYLLLHREFPQARQHAAFLFWPDSSEAQAQSNLRHLLHSLRYALPDADAYVDFGSRTIQWRTDAPLMLDVADFELALAEAESQQRSDSGAHAEHLLGPLQRAADLYMGDLLPGCYDEWILAPRERLREKYQSTLERLVYLFEQRGDLNGAILYAQRLLRQDPLLEENYRRLMSLHLANGDRAGVLNVYKQCARILKRELGIEPGASTATIMRQAREVSAHPPGVVGTSTGGERQEDSAESNTPGRKHSAPGSRYLAPTPTNLPAQTTVFFGRERDLAEVSALLRHPDVRLVTLTGTPGTGKTRLAITVAASLLKAFSGGVFFVPLAAIDNPANVMPAIASALGVAEPASESILKGLRVRIGDAPMLLVLDNFEQVLPAAPALADLVAGCPQLKLLTTSRAALNLRGEHEFSVQPLSTPPRDMSLRPDELLNYESVALFLDRAREVSPQFALSTTNARIVADICRRLEGLPLAIELSAARAKVLSPAAILSRLDRRLKLLTGGRLDLPPRQRALETAIAWSYNLLDEQERSLFRTLSVFSGGFTLEAIEAVAESDGVDLLEALGSLLGKSLLVRSQLEGGEGGEEMDGQGEPRFGMLETLKEYAWERLVESGGESAISRRHALYFLWLADTAGGELNGPGQQEWMSKLDREHDNLRTALRWAIACGEVEIALRLSGALGLFWERRGYLTEGRVWLRRALDLDSSRDPRYRAAALYHCGVLALRQRDYAAARPLLEESCALYKERGDKEGQSKALSALAVMTLDRDYEQAVQLHMESLQLRREIGDKAGIARTLQNLGFIKMHQGKWSEAAALAEEARAIFRDLGSQSDVAYTIYVLAMIAAEQGDYELGEKRFEECLQISRKTRNQWLTAWALHGLGNLLYGSGQYGRANSVFAEAQEMFAVLGDKLGTAHTLVNQAREAQRTSDYGQATRIYSQALELARELDNDGVIGSCLAGLAGLAAVAGQHRPAAKLFGQAEKLLGKLSTSIEREGMTLGLEVARAALDSHAWDAAWEEGNSMTLQEAIALAGSVGE